MPKLERKPAPRGVSFTDPEEETQFDAEAEAAQAEVFDAKGTAVEPDEAPDFRDVKDEGATAAPVETAPTKDDPTASKPVAARPRATKGATRGATPFVSLEDTEEFLNVLYWGREGSGKTTDALSAANLGRVLVINAEGGLKKKALLNRGINLDNIQLYPRPGEPVTYDGLDEAYRTIKADLMDDPKSWFAVIMDSITEVSESATTDVADDRVSKARKRGADIDTIDSFFTDRSDYGTSGKMMRDLLRKFRDLQCHFIITALERRDVDEDTSKVAYGPAVPPGLQKDTLGYVDIVLHTKEEDEDKGYYRALTKKAGKFRAKDRLDSLPKVLVNPSFERVLAYVGDELTDEGDPMQEVIRAEAADKATPKAKPLTAAQKRAQAKADAASPADAA